MITLQPPLTNSGVWPPGGAPDEALRHAEAFLRGGRQARWHIPRSGRVHARTGHTSYHLWCGQVASEGWPGQLPLLRCDDWPDDGAPVCGTCAGRAVGADRTVEEMLFAPRGLDPPPLCPGSRISGLYLHVPGNPGGTLARPTVICLACDAVTVEAGGSRGGYGWTALHAAPHEPEDLVPACPFHGWRELRPDGTGSAACPCGAVW